MEAQSVQTGEIKWSEVLFNLRLAMTQQSFDQHFRTSKVLEWKNGDVKELTVEVMNSYAADWIEHRLKQKVETIIRRLYNMDVVTKWKPASAPVLDDMDYFETDPDDRELLVKLTNYDPQANSFIMVYAYTQRFWQPYMGRGPYALWQLLRGYAWTAERTGMWPSLRQICNVLGTRRQTIIGQRAGDDGWKEGWLERLEREQLVIHVVRNSRYQFIVQDRLPILTPYQALLLRETLQEEHIKWLEKYNYNVERWKKIQRQTLVKKIDKYDLI